MTLPAATNGAPAPGPEPASAPSSPTVDLSTIVKMLEPLVSQVPKLEGRMSEMGKDFGRLRDRMGKFSKTEGDGEPSGDRSVPPPAGLTMDDIEAAIAFGGLKSQLPKSAQEHLDQLRETGGVSFKEALRIAQAMALVISNTPATQSPAGAIPAASPTGYSATQAQRTAPAHPRSLSEFAELAQRDRARFEALKTDPTFDPTSLR